MSSITRSTLLVILLGLTLCATANDETPREEKIICGTVSEFVHKVGKGFEGLQYVLYEGHRFLVSFTDGRSLSALGVPEMTVTVGKMYSFVVREDSGRKGRHILVKTVTTNHCGYDTDTTGETAR